MKEKGGERGGQNSAIRKRRGGGSQPTKLQNVLKVPIKLEGGRAPAQTRLHFLEKSLRTGGRKLTWEQRKRT